jgi:hypothetical protein
MPTDDYQPLSKGEARAAGLSVPEAGPPPRLRSLQDIALDAWEGMMSNAIAATAPGYPVAPPIATGTRFPVPTCRVLDDPGPARVIGTVGVFSGSFPGDEVSPKDLMTGRRPLAPEPTGEWVGQAQAPPSGRRPFSRHETTTPDVR